MNEEDIHCEEILAMPEEDILYTVRRSLQCPKKTYTVRRYLQCLQKTYTVRRSLQCLKQTYTVWTS